MTVMLKNNANNPSLGNEAVGELRVLPTSSGALLHKPTQGLPNDLRDCVSAGGHKASSL